MNYNAEPALAKLDAIRPVLEQIANKWSILILTVLCDQPARFNVVKRRLDPITHKALAEALRRLQRNGLVNRRVITSSPVAVEYSITPLGRTLKQPFMALVNWAERHGPGVAKSQSAFDQRDTER